MGAQRLFFTVIHFGVSLKNIADTNLSKRSSSIFVLLNGLKKAKGNLDKIKKTVQNIKEAL